MKLISSQAVTGSFSLVEHLCKPQAVTPAWNEDLSTFIEAARTRIKFYGETIGLEWLEALEAKVESQFEADEEGRELAYQEGYDLGQRQCDCTEKKFEEKYDALVTSLRNTLEDA